MRRVTIDNTHLLELTGPLAYVVYVKEKPAYVGASRKGIARPFCGQHHKITKLNKQDITSLELILCDSAEEAFRIEELLIQKLDPDLNARNPRVKRENRPPKRNKPNWTKTFDAQTMLDEFIESVINSI